MTPRLTYANVVSTLCLFIVLGGSAVALDVVPFAQKAGFAKKAGFATKAGKAENAAKVDGFSASAAPRPNRLLALDETGKLPMSVGAVGLRGPAGPEGDAGATGVQGSTGAEGALGAPGVKGDTGSQGLPGISGHQIVSDTVSGVSNTFSLTVPCPGGKQVLGGGASVTDNFGKTFVKRAYPSSGTAFFGQSGTVANEASVSQTLSVYAVCAVVSN
jgi:hypothetical protein